MKLGVGVITTPRRYGLWSEEDLKLTEGTELVIALDAAYAGACYGRNDCIKELYERGCDYIALCDDDLIYHRKGWLELCVEAMERAGTNYCCLPHVLEGKRSDIFPGLELWDSYIGAFYILSRKAIEEVGYFSTELNGYGFEDVHYKLRLKKQYGAEGNPIVLPYLVSSQDVMGLNPPPSRDDKMEMIKKNEPIFERLTKNGTIYYPYTDH